jgi:hypothetical protein
LILATSTASKRSLFARLFLSLLDRFSNDHCLRRYLNYSFPIQCDPLSNHFYVLIVRIEIDDQAINHNTIRLTRRCLNDWFCKGDNDFFFFNYRSSYNHRSFNLLYDNWGYYSYGSRMVVDFLCRHMLLLLVGIVSVPEEGTQVLWADGGTTEQPCTYHSARAATIENYY